jgi:hypothetical protein
MKKKYFFSKPVWAVLVLALAFAACSNPTGPEDPGSPDDPALKASVMDAESEINRVTVALDAAEVALGGAWATPEQVNALNAALEEAKSLGADADEAAVEEAKNKLTVAISKFKTDVATNTTGTKESGFTQDELNKLIARAKAAKARVAISENGDDISPTAFWTSQNTMDGLNTAIGEADSPSDLDQAYLALSNWLFTFNNGKFRGSTPDTVSLTNAISSAETARTGVRIAASKDEAAGATWVTQAQWNLLDKAYTTAKAAAAKTEATKKELADTTSALNTAITAFNSAKNTNSFVPIVLPDSLRVVIGKGYDITGAYTSSQEIKGTILDLNQLINDARVVRDPNLHSASYQTSSGETITQYQESLMTKASVSASAGVEGVGSFSSEIGGSFGMERASSDAYAFATSTSRIVSDAYFIQDKDGLTKYITDQFVQDVKNLNPEAVIAKYGTHVMLGGVLGARLDYHLSVRKKSGAASYDIGAFVRTKAELTIEGITAGGGTEAEINTKYSNSFDTETVEVTTKALGGLAQYAQSIHNKQDYDQWINSIEGNEVWCDYYSNSLLPIYELVGSDRWPVDSDYRMPLYEAYRNYFNGKKINVKASTQRGYEVWSGEVSKPKGADVVTVQGDDQLDSRGDKKIFWSLSVDLSLRGDNDIDATFLYEVWEGIPDYTKLRLTQRVRIPMGSHDIVQLEGRTSQYISGDVEGQNHGYVEVTRLPSNDLLKALSVRIDGNSKDDKGEIGVAAQLNLNFTERVN